MIDGQRRTEQSDAAERACRNGPKTPKAASRGREAASESWGLSRGDDGGETAGDLAGLLSIGSLDHDAEELLGARRA